MKKRRKLISCLLVLTLLFTTASLPAYASYTTNGYETNELVDGKMYIIQNGFQSATCIDTAGNWADGSAAYIRNISSNNTTNSLGQTIYSLRKIWYPKKITSTAYGLLSCFAPKLCLFTPGGSAAPYYTNLTYFTNTNYQRWIPEYAGNGYFWLETARSYGGETKYLDLYNSATTTSRLEAYTYSANSTSLRWRFYPAYQLGESIITYGTSLAEGSYENEWERGQCTWYCRGRAMEKIGFELEFNKALGDGNNHNAGNWYAIVTNTDKGTTVKPNSIAVFKKNGSTSGEGHVVFVEYIEDGYVYYTEANYGPALNDGIFNVQYDGVLKRKAEGSFTTMFSGLTYQGCLYLT